MYFMFFIFHTLMCHSKNTNKICTFYVFYSVRHLATFKLIPTIVIYIGQLYIASLLLNSANYPTRASVCIASLLLKSARWPITYEPVMTRTLALELCRTETLINLFYPAIKT